MSKNNLFLNIFWIFRFLNTIRTQNDGFFFLRNFYKGTGRMPQKSMISDNNFDDNMILIVIIIISI
jgi:hypothetical protein